MVFSPVYALAYQAVNEHKAQQRHRELAKFTKMLLDWNLSKVVEIGAYDNGCTWYWHEMGFEVVSIDYHHRGPVVEGVQYLTGHSADMAEFVDACDAVFIDGDHSYEGVKADWENYAPKVREGGLVGFHDIVVHDGSEVARFWDELKVTYKTRSIVDEKDGPAEWGGIGAVYL